MSNHVKQFSNPKLVALYDSMNSLGEDSNFWIEEISKISPKTIIDFGCGTGLLACELAKKGYKVIGIEPEKAMLDVATEKMYSNKVQWIEGGFEKLESLKADVILMTSHVAQFLIDDIEWQNLLNSAYKSLKKGGLILFDSKTPSFPPYTTFPKKDNPKRIYHNKFGCVDWYYELIDIQENKVKYALHYLFKDSKNEIVAKDEVIFRSFDEISGSLQSAGFKLMHVYGDWDHSTCVVTSPEMIFIAIKD